MTRAIAILALVGSAICAPASAQDWDCRDPGNLPQQGMNFCAARDFERADAELNATWAKVRTAIKAREAEYDGFKGWFDTLLAGQRGWIAYRDGQCEAEAKAFDGGSMQPLILFGCKARLTETRTKELADLIEEY